jgi:hypothetical protein
VSRNQIASDIASLRYRLRFGVHGKSESELCQPAI